jgi:hypothetical protein
LKPSISVLFGFTFKKALLSAFLGFNSLISIYNFIFFFQSVKISFSVGTVSVRWQKNVPFCALAFFSFVSRCFLHCPLFFGVATNVCVCAKLVQGMAI